METMISLLMTLMGMEFVAISGMVLTKLSLVEKLLKLVEILDPKRLHPLRYLVIQILLQMDRLHSRLHPSQRNLPQVQLLCLVLLRATSPHSSHLC